MSHHLSLLDWPVKRVVTKAAFFLPASEETLLFFQDTKVCTRCFLPLDRYATRLQAEKALAAGHGSRLTDTVMLGVQRVSDDEVWR